MIRRILLVLGVIVLLAVTVVIVKLAILDEETKERQAELEPFYTPPDPLPEGAYGEIIRQEELPEDETRPGATAWRILYRSKDAAGDPTVSSGLLYVPDGEAPAGGRPLVAWAHGTAGMGVACAGSRTDPPMKDSVDWLDDMLAAGLAVTATDYTGLGTPGDLQYLVGDAEANDVIGSIIAARSFDQLDVNDQVALWGHSQGGHSVLWTADALQRALPEVDFVGAAAAAPAAELVPLIGQQWANTIAWVIGPEIVEAWPRIYPGLDPDALLTDAARRNTARIAQDCILTAFVEGTVREEVFRQEYFDGNPLDVPAWASALRAETVPLPPADLPVFLAQGTADTVVLPNTTALLIERYCDAGVDLTTHWMPGVSHIPAANDAGPAVTAWLQARFAGEEPTSTCTEPLPVEPAEAGPTG
jgi:alpha-beta hydrolase superfamily lysophospholipase